MRKGREVAVPMASGRLPDWGGSPLPEDREANAASSVVQFDGSSSGRPPAAAKVDPKRTGESFMDKEQEGMDSRYGIALGAEYALDDSKRLRKFKRILRAGHRKSD